MTPCTCGEPHPHAIATRRSFDNVHVELDSAGALWIGHFRSSTSGAAPVRTDAAIERCRAVGRLVLDNACILTAKEITHLYRRGRVLTEIPGTLRELQARLDRPARPSLVWTTIATDRDGTPTERVSVLPRMWWPGLAVWDYCGGPGSSGGRYEVARLVTRAGPYGHAPKGDATYEGTGFRFSRLADLWAYLDSARVTS